MPNAGRAVEHRIIIRASADSIYGLIADVESWPRIFPPTVYVDRIDQGPAHERIRIWAQAKGVTKSWTSRRQFDPGSLRIDFQQEVCAPPVAEMGGAWIIEPLSADESRVRLLHDYRAVGDDPAKLAWIDEAVDRHSRAELAALQTNLELPEAALAERLLVFEDTVQIDGSVKDVYDFLNEAQLWSERLPHVSRVVLTEETPGVQRLQMDTMTKDGSTHTTTSVRICFPHHQIVYKQIGLPPLMTLHTGAWRLAENGSGVSATFQHTVVLNDAELTAVPGADADLGQAGAYVRTALSTNSLVTLEYAKEYTQGRR